MAKMDLAEKGAIGQASYDAFNRRDIDALLALYDSECEWDFSNFSGWPERQIYRGHKGLVEFFHVWLDPWDDFQLEITEVRDLPGDRAFAVGRGKGRGRASGVPVELPPIGQIVEYRDGRILRIVNYSDVDEARRAAGI